MAEERQPLLANEESTKHYNLVGLSQSSFWVLVGADPFIMLRADPGSVSSWRRGDVPSSPLLTGLWVS